MADQRFGLDFEPPFGAEQPRHHDHRRRRANIAKHRAMRRADQPGLGGIEQEYPRPHNVVDRPAKLLDRRDDHFEAARRLHPRIADRR